MTATEAAGTPAPRPVFARVAPPLPVDGLFTYAVPAALAGRVRPGVRVLVPFGSRRLTAMCVAVDDVPPEGIELRPLIALVEDEPLAGADILQLARWVARRCGCTVGEALDAALPRAVKSGSRARTIEHVALAPALAAHPLAVTPKVDELQGKRPKQARALRILGDRGGELPVRELMSLARVSRSPVESLARAGLVVVRKVEQSHDPLRRPVARTGPLELTDEQRAAHDAIVAAVDARRPEVFLLHGVTGSGKTEVYLQVLDRVVRAGRQGIVLVPEISLTPQTVRRFRERFDRVAVLHSRLTDAERSDQWRAIHRGEADVVVGARSAVFAPVPSLGLIVLDEEHETSFKQQSVPRYHAREVAIERGRLAGAAVVLGTATPSLEADERARAGGATRLPLHERVAGGRTPEIVMVDLTLEERRKGFSFVTDPLRAAMEDALSRGGQVMLFLNRRGWASVMLCRTCRAPLRCPHCDVSLTVHRRARRVLCHYCGHETPIPGVCPTPGCGKPLAPLGFGTEKVEQEVRQSFLHASVARMDSDTMSGRGAHESVLADFAEGRSQVLIGTQMIAKGLDFPNVLLVGVICADSALFLPDYRAAERTFQLLAQVVGRTGRGPQGGRVVVQAYDPRHFSIRAGVAQDHEAFARIERPHRREAGYPPYTRLVRAIAQARSNAHAARRAEEIAEDLRAALPTHDGPGADGPGAGGSGAAPDPSGSLPVGPVSVLGPAPAPLSRLNDNWRHHVVVKCPDDESTVEAVLQRLRPHAHPTRQVRVIIDVDPITMM